MIRKTKRTGLASSGGIDNPGVVGVSTPPDLRDVRIA
jgi:hypothetical protein